VHEARTTPLLCITLWPARRPMGAVATCSVPAMAFIDPHVVNVALHGSATNLHAERHRNLQWPVNGYTLSWPP